MNTREGRPRESSPAIRRLLAFLVDWLVLAAWAGLLFGLVMLASGGDPAPPHSALVAQGLALAAMTLPFTLYFAACESSRFQATLGKRVLGLVVTGTGGGSLGFGRSLLRNACKLAPWEAGHTIAHQLGYAGDGSPSPWIWACAAVAVLGPLWWLGSMFASGRTPYDRWAGARVGVRGPGTRS
jgi:uncharacterized RDD family membrane protein YckC